MSIKGRVIKSTGSWYDIKDENGNYLQAKLKGAFKIKGIKSTNPIAVGDIVHFDLVAETGTGLIHTIDERKNYIIRKSTNLSKQTHIIAANIDRAYLIVTIAEPRTSTGFIDRFLVTAEAYHIPTTLIFNKQDLVNEKSHPILERYQKIYSDIGYQCLNTSALNGAGIEALKTAIQDKVVLFSGHSGVGKSALINALDPNIQRKTGDISGVHKKGKHTTTFAELLELGFGGFIIDTPGIKEFGIVNFELNEVSHYFPEMRKRLSGCRFNNCSHVHEPGCAIVEAVENGDIHIERYENYINILNNVDEESNNWK